LLSLIFPGVRLLGILSPHFFLRSTPPHDLPLGNPLISSDSQRGGAVRKKGTLRVQDAPVCEVISQQDYFF
ncbi:MAG: hypothetical protein K2H21_00350, partial [Muribaculaceae bacterium]|nr:hypothetical protein [Muribaculaceae bacterium]